MELEGVKEALSLLGDNDAKISPHAGVGML